MPRFPEGLAPRSRARHVWILVIAVAMIGALVPTRTTAQELPHHVIFLLDRSGSAVNTSAKLRSLKSAIKTGLPGILSRGIGGRPLYDADRDLSSAFAFGLHREHPWFAHTVLQEHGFLKTLWLQAPGRTVDTLAARLPTEAREFTAFTTTFPLSMRMLHLERSRSGIPDRSFSRTFIVMVTDGEPNTSADGLSEIRNIHGALEGDDDFREKLAEDGRAVAHWAERLRQYYSIRSVEDEATSFGGATGEKIGRRTWALVREVVPHRLTSVDALIDKGPEAEIELVRRQGDRYVGDLRIQPRQNSAQSVPYELVGFRVRLPDQPEPATMELPSREVPFVATLDLRRDQVPDARVQLEYDLARRDPVYGQAVQRFEDEVRFRSEPNSTLLGLWTLEDGWMKLLPPELDQEQVVTIFSWAAFAAMLASLAALVRFFLFPSPTVQVSLARPVSEGVDELVVIDLDRAHSGSIEPYPLAFRSLVFRTVPSRLFGIPWRRRSRASFDVDVDLEIDCPGVVSASSGIAGFASTIEPRRTLRKIAHGAEVSIGLSPARALDFVGEDPQRVRARVEVTATHRSRLRRKRLPAIRDEFDLRFLSERPDVVGRFSKGRPEELTGETQRRLSEDADGVLTVPHARERRRADAEREPEFWLEVASGAQLVCSLPRSADVRLRLYDAADMTPIRDALDLLVPAAPEGSGWRSAPLPADDGSAAFTVSGLEKSDLLCCGVYVDFRKLPPPALEGDDYVVEAILSPGADEEDWNPTTSRASLRVGPDPRVAGLVFEVLPARIGAPGAWIPYDAAPANKELRVDVEVPLHWPIGAREQATQFARLRLGNTAHSGEGEVRVSVAGMRVSAAPEQDLTLVPPPGDVPLVNARFAGEPIGLTESAQWEFPSERENVAIELELWFDPRGIADLSPEIRRCRYVLSLDCAYEVRKETGANPEQGSFALMMPFDVARYAGDYVLAIDLGTSATVAAFEQAIAAIYDRAGGYSSATLDLQARYRELLPEWDKREKPINVRDEKLSPNAETGTRFIPSQLAWRGGATLGAADFVYLPAPNERIARDPARTIFYLKGHILRGDEALPDLLDAEARGWLDQSGEERRKPVPLDGLLQSAYRTLIDDYVRPILEEGDREDYLERIVVTHPNNFTLGHVERIEDVLRSAFGDRYELGFISESSAVAIYSAQQADRFLATKWGFQSSDRILVYDIGAGTLDVTYAEMHWGESGGRGLEEFEVLFNYGRPIAGNRLDECIARIVDARIRRAVAGSAGDITYDHEIVISSSGSPDGYAARMLPMKRALQIAKNEASKLDSEGRESFRVEVPFETTANIENLIVAAKAGLTESGAERLGMRFDRKANKLSVLLEAQELFEHPLVERWLQQTTDEVMADLRAALDEMKLVPRLDGVVLSGRTILFPPLKARLERAIERELGLSLAEVPVTRLDSNESKEAVALGALIHTRLHGQVRFSDKAAWGRYGIIYYEGKRRRFIEFWSHASSREETDRELTRGGRTTLLFDRTRTIERTGGEVDVAVTFSQKPDVDLSSLEWHSHFTLVYSIGEDILRNRSRFDVRMAIDESHRLTISVRDEAGMGTEVRSLPIASAEMLGRNDWPYRALRTEEVEMPSPVPLESLSENASLSEEEADESPGAEEEAESR